MRNNGDISRVDNDKLGGKYKLQNIQEEEEGIEE